MKGPWFITPTAPVPLILVLAPLISDFFRSLSNRSALPPRRLWHSSAASPPRSAPKSKHVYCHHRPGRREPRVTAASLYGSLTRLSSPRRREQRRNRRRRDAQPSDRALAFQGMPIPAPNTTRRAEHTREGWAGTLSHSR